VRRNTRIGRVDDPTTIGGGIRSNRNRNRAESVCLYVYPGVASVGELYSIRHQTTGWGNRERGMGMTGCAAWNDYTLIRGEWMKTVV
jgi:hypothetical protein